MNCRNFPELATSIARAELMDAATLDEAHEHAATCTECAALLADEIRLTEGLRLLSKTHEALPISARAETALREAFRARTTQGPQQNGGQFPYFRLASGIAAVAILMLGASIFLRTDVPSGDPLKSATVTVTPDAQPEIKPGRPIEGPTVVDSHPSIVTVSRNTRLRARGMAAVSRDGSYVDARLGEFRPASYEPEETTEFVPIIQGSDPGPMNSGQVLRVMVPRSAMNYFGLPDNVDRANEKVKADVLLGEDGLARAIRFVR
jgi:hypothetical protein